MQCPSCGKGVEAEWDACRECGAGLRGEKLGSGAESPSDPLVGTLLGQKYRLEERLGAGGMATVYRARREIIGDTVAVKILHSEQLQDANAPERFRREAQAAARLKHPNVVTIHDFGVSERCGSYLVMEFVTGQSLRRMIQEQGPFAPQAALAIIKQVCAALNEAHHHGIVHRDIKPDNIIVNCDSARLEAKVLDFGIASLRDSALADGRLTQTGSVMGTPHYMSPEQCMGEELDGRSDIYSLGVILYEMLTGVLPFNSPSASAVIVQHVSQAPASPRLLNASIPEAVEAVVLRAMAKKREMRQQRAEELARDLENAVSGNLMPALRPEVAPRQSESLPTVYISPSDFSTGAAFQNSAATGPAPRRSRRLTLVVVGGGLVAVTVLAAVIGYYYFSSSGVTANHTGTPSQASAGGQSSSEPDPPRPQPHSSAEAGNLLVEKTAAAPSALHAPVPPLSPKGGGRPVAAKSSLTIRSKPGSTVSIAGSPQGRTNEDGVLQLSGLTPGKLLVRIGKAQYRDVERIIELQPNRQETISVALEPLPGMLKVAASEPSAHIVVAGVGSATDRFQAELAPGRYQVTASKPYFKAASVSIDIAAGQTVEQTLTLLALSRDELLAQSEKDIKGRRFSEAASNAERVLQMDPDHPRANLNLGLAHYNQGRYRQSLAYMRRAISLNEVAALPIKHHHRVGFNDDLCSGSLILQGRWVWFRSEDRSGHDFRVDRSKIVELKAEAHKAGRIHVKVSLPKEKKDKEDRKTYNFHMPQAFLQRLDPNNPTSIIQVYCNNCDAQTMFLYQLLSQMGQQP